jgi:hypothetical protein
MATLFCYAFDLGFGIHRARQQWWIAVLETAGQHHHWQAQPLDPENPDHGRHKIDRFTIHADHQNTIALLRKAGLEKLLKDTPPNYHWEVRGTLLAVASPNNTDPQSLNQLLTSARKLAHLLAETAET